MRNVRTIFWILATGAFGGCVHPAQHASAPGYKVQTGGDCLELSDGKGRTPTPILEKVSEHLREGRLASAESLICRRLDEAIEQLRRRDPATPPSDGERLMARLVDEKLGHPANDGFSARLDRRASGIDAVEQAFESIQRAAQTDDWKRVKSLTLKNERTIASYPYYSVRAKLALAEAQRRLAEYDAASKAWQHAACLAASLAPRWPAPTMWEAVAAQRPASTPWPADVNAGFAPTLPLAPTKIAPESVVWLAIGRARLDRGEPSAALSAFQRAEVFDQSPDWRDGLQVHQAKALLALDQTPAAVSLLTSLADRTTSPWHRTAYALLGSGKFRDGNTEQARVLLARALDGAADEFPDRAESLADYGLVLLSLGDPAGLNHLHAAQKQFESSSRFELLLTALTNEAAYEKNAGHPGEARELERRIQSLQRANVSVQEARSSTK